MNNITKKCGACNKPLGQSQYMSRKQESEIVKKDRENLVCCNYPDCPKAEKEIK